MIFYIFHLAILASFAIVGLFFSIKREGIFQKIITFGLIFSFLMTCTSNIYVVTVGMLLIVIMAVMTTVFGFKANDINKLERFGICTAGLFYAIKMLFQIMHWPGINIMKLILIIPLISYLTGLMININKRQSINEIGFMFIWLILIIFDIMNFLI